MNILVIFADQQHKYALGAVDSQFITPNLDTLCKEGVLFENGYSNNPVCGPYRGCLMTGSYTNHCQVINNGDPLPDHLPSMAQILRDHGYMTGFTGKWHLGGNGATPIPENIRGGFERFIGYQCYNGFEPKPPYNNAVVFFDENNQPHQFDKHRTDATTDLAISQLNEMIASGKPFFQLVGNQAPHYPEQPSETFAKLYEGKIFDKIDSNKRKKAEAEKAASLASKQDAKPAAMPAAPAKVPPMVEDGIPEEVVAVIAAAVAAMGDGKYTLRSLTRVNPSRGKWGAAGAVFGTDPF